MGRMGDWEAGGKWRLQTLPKALQNLCKLSMLFKIQTNNPLNPSKTTRLVSTQTVPGEGDSRCERFQRRWLGDLPLDHSAGGLWGRWVHRLGRRVGVGESGTGGNGGFEDVFSAKLKNKHNVRINAKFKLLKFN